MESATADINAVHGYRTSPFDSAARTTPAKDAAQIPNAEAETDAPPTASSASKKTNESDEVHNAQYHWEHYNRLYVHKGAHAALRYESTAKPEVLEDRDEPGGLPLHEALAELIVEEYGPDYVLTGSLNEKATGHDVAAVAEVAAGKLHLEQD